MAFFFPPLLYAAGGSIVSYFVYKFLHGSPPPPALAPVINSSAHQASTNQAPSSVLTTEYDVVIDNDEIHKPADFQTAFKPDFKDHTVIISKRGDKNDPEDQKIIAAVVSHSGFYRDEPTYVIKRMNFMGDAGLQIVKDSYISQAKIGDKDFSVRVNKFFDLIKSLLLVAIGAAAPDHAVEELCDALKVDFQHRIIDARVEWRSVNILVSDGDDKIRVLMCSLRRKQFIEETKRSILGIDYDANTKVDATEMFVVVANVIRSMWELQWRRELEREIETHLDKLDQKLNAEDTKERVRAFRKCVQDLVAKHVSAPGAVRRINNSGCSSEEKN